MSKSTNAPDQDKFVIWASFIFSTVVVLVGIPVWVFTTFATKDSLKEAIEALKNYSDMGVTNAIKHSDMNRSVMESKVDKEDAILLEIKENLKLIEAHVLWDERNKK